jgi:hypothetical protein
MRNKMQEVRIKNEEKMQRQREIEEQRQKELFVSLELR